jgi:hypothetical protein
MERVLSDARRVIAKILRRVEAGCANLQEAASLLVELTATSDWFAGSVEHLLGCVPVHSDPALLLVPAVIQDAPLDGNFRAALRTLDTARDLLRSSSAHLLNVRRDMAATARDIPVEAAFDTLRRTLPATGPRWWRHPLALAWGTHLGQCLAELVSAGESLALSIELAARSDGRARANVVSGTTTTSDLKVAASSSAECVAALRKSMAEFRVLSHVLSHGVR